jgi:mono/diheme cytochrome c family protein
MRNAGRRQRKQAMVARMSLAVALALLLPGLVSIPASGADGKAPLDGRTLFGTKCGECHRLSLTTDRREWKPDWKEIVNRMARRRDGWISAEEAAAIVDYLGSEYGKD